MKIFDFLRNTKFTFHRIRHFDPATSFTHMKTKADSLHFDVSVDKLLTYTDAMLCGKENPSQGKEEMVNFIKTIHKINPSDIWESSLEAPLFLSLAKAILVHLSNQMMLNKSYVQLLKKSPHPLFSIANLGMGSFSTWHGIPDARIRATSGELNLMSTNDINYTSDGDSIVVEAKKKMKPQDASQLIALSVISSFTEHNLHQDLNPMVPSLLINSSSMQICLFDCVNDLLLITGKIQLVDFNQLAPVINVPALWLLWFMIHHRYACIIIYLVYHVSGCIS